MTAQTPEPSAFARLLQSQEMDEYRRFNALLQQLEAAPTEWLEAVVEHCEHLLRCKRIVEALGLEDIDPDSDQ